MLNETNETNSLSVILHDDKKALLEKIASASINVQWPTVFLRPVAGFDKNNEL